jgi:phage pi2 protein 07
MKECKEILNNKKEKLLVTLLARTKISELCPVAYRLIKITDFQEMESTRVLVPAKALVSVLELKKTLLTCGHNPNVTKEYWIQAHQEVIKETDKIITLCYKPGFYGDVYLRVNDIVIGKVKGDKPVLHPGAKNHLSVEDKQDTLNLWKMNVAPFALHSSRIMLALCCGFSGFLLKLSGMEGGGFHLWGMSSIGKTSSAYMLASLAGSPKDIVVLWNNTDKGLEEIAVAHNDSYLVLDESKLLDKDVLAAAKIMQHRVYTLSGGKGKTRSAIYENNVAEWQVSIFSTGECSLQQLADSGNIERLEGENVRVIDVHADAGAEMGIFESLPDSVNSSNELVHVIKDATHRYYGSAKPAFLKHLVAYIQDDRESMKRKLEKGIEFFLNKHKVDRNSGIQVRIAKRFAIAYVAGSMAVKYGVLPFTKQEVMKGISTCYQDSLKAVLSEPEITKPLMGNSLNAIIDFCKKGDLLNLIGNDLITQTAIKKSPIIIHKVKGRTVYAVDKDLVHNCLPKSQRKGILMLLTKQGVLLSDANKEYSTIQIIYKRKQVGRRYCFICKKLDKFIQE